MKKMTPNAIHMIRNSLRILIGYRHKPYKDAKRGIGEGVVGGAAATLVGQKLDTFRRFS